MSAGSIAAHLFSKWRIKQTNKQKNLIATAANIILFCTMYATSSSSCGFLHFVPERILSRHCHLLNRKASAITFQPQNKLNALEWTGIM